MHPAYKASRERIRLPMSRIRKLKVSSAARITQQVMTGMGPEPVFGLLTPHHWNSCISCDQRGNMHGRREKTVSAQQIDSVFNEALLWDLQGASLDILHIISFSGIVETQWSQGNLGVYLPSRASNGSPRSLLDSYCILWHLIIPGNSRVPDKDICVGEYIIPKNVSRAYGPLLLSHPSLPWDCSCSQILPISPSNPLLGLNASLGYNGAVEKSSPRKLPHHNQPEPAFVPVQRFCSLLPSWHCS